MATPDQTKHFSGQLASVLDAYADLVRRARHDDLSGPPEWEHQKIITMAMASIERVSPPGAIYPKRAAAIVEREGWIGTILKELIGVIEALKADLEAGYLSSFQELIHAEAFGDFLGMARHLADEGYKDPAAVIAGSTLEAHLRNLALKFGLSADDQSGRPLKADRLNADLAKEGAYSKLDQKSVTAWLDLRNQAAHGRYAEYSLPQVQLMLDGVRDFVARNSA